MTLKPEYISKTFGKGSVKTKVLKDINLEVQPEEFIILSGASGSGKSTLLSILGGLLTPTDSKVLYEGHDLYSNYKNSTELRLNDVGFIFQASHLVPYLTVEEQLTVIVKEAGVNKKEAVSNAKCLLAEIGLKDRSNAFPHMLLGGEKQRVTIIRAFTDNPRITLADELTASLDASCATKAVEMIKERIKSEQTVGIMITHDERLSDYTDRVVELEDGKILN